MAGVAAALLVAPGGVAIAADPLPPAAAATVIVHPGEDVAAIVAGAPAGTRFRFAAGVYRGLEITPKDHDSFVGEPGAILSGARLVTGFTRDGAVYAAAVAVRERPVHGYCVAGRVCDRPYDLFIDGVRQEPALAPAALAPGRYFIDYAAGKLYVGSDPAGKAVELATAEYAFSAAAAYVRLAGLVVEKYANAAQSGAIGGNGRPIHWTIENCDIRDNHGVGIEIGDGTRVSHSLIRRNGQLGIGGGQSRLVIEDDEIADNNTAGFATAWEGGGVKLTRSIHAVLKGNYVHDNHGPGLWSDIDDVDTVYEDNRIEDNDDPGIQHEISYEAVIRGNRLRGNGRAPHGWVWGAQILVQNSQDVEVRDNAVTVPPGGGGIVLVEQRRERGPFGPHLVRDCTVEHNTIAMAGDSGIAAGAATDYGDSRIARSGNLFDANTYRLADSGGRFWAWPSVEGLVDFATFRHRFGQEANGILAGPAAPAPAAAAPIPPRP